MFIFLMYAGQEEATIEFDENIQITPFNMREELEEGHFDTDGTYIFDKSKVECWNVCWCDIDDVILMMVEEDDVGWLEGL